MKRVGLHPCWLLPALAVALLPALVADKFASEAQAQVPKKGDFVAFDAHLKHIKEAKFNDYKSLAGVKVASEANFNQMKEHLQTLHQDMKVMHTFIGHTGHHIDCVPIDQQPSLQHPALKNHKVQRTAPALHAKPKHAADKKKYPSVSHVPPHLTKGKKDAMGHEMYPPEGMIPVQRVTLAEMTKFHSLKHFLRKTGGAPKGDAKKKAEPEPVVFGAVDPTIHRYAHAYQYIDNVGGNSWLNLWEPAPTKHQFSLSQQWYTGGNPLQTLEGGWQVYPDKYGHNKPVLFIYWTADDYNNTGAYNLDSPGFIQVNHSYIIGGAWAPLSTTGGTQWGFDLTYYRDPANGNWWLYIQGTAIGYYPKALYGTGQMSKHATQIDYGGEVTGQTASGQMGSGALANAGWQKAAFQNEIYYFPTGGNSAWANLTASAPTPASYTIDVSNQGGSWGTHFYFGGQGAQ